MVAELCKGQRDGLLQITFVLYRSVPAVKGEELARVVLGQIVEIKLFSQVCSNPRM